MSEEAARYATEFRMPVFGVISDIVVQVDLTTMEGSAQLNAVKSLIAPPPFFITLDDLRRFRDSISVLLKAASQMGEPASDATEHQLNCAHGCGKFIVVKPNGKSATYVLSLGHIHREGAVGSFNLSELNDAIAACEKCLQVATSNAKRLFLTAREGGVSKVADQALVSLGTNERVRCTWYQVHVWTADGVFYIGAKDDKKTYVTRPYITLAYVHMWNERSAWHLRSRTPMYSTICYKPDLT